MLQTQTATHALSMPRLGLTSLDPVPQMPSLGAHDFDVDVRTGFMPPLPPVAHMPQKWVLWEHALQDALSRKLKLGHRKDLTEADKNVSEQWRHRVQIMPTLPTGELMGSEVTLRRAHLVLTFITHIFVHTLSPAPSSDPIRIPPCLSVPLLQVSSALDVPPVLTYSDNVLYNWRLTTPQSPTTSSINSAHLRSQTTFSGTPSEEHFYLTSARIEVAGVSALSLLRLTMNEVSVGDLLSLRRISQYLTQLATVIDAMTAILNNVQHGCTPRVFYEDIRPWFRGAEGRPWVFEGADAAGLPQPHELSGPSAAQSSLIHVLDIFLGVDSRAQAKGSPFLERMQLYMPRRHRAFLDHLKANPRPVRDLVDAPGPGAPDERGVRAALKEAYNASVLALKRFRDEHLRIATLYIVSQARRANPATLPEPADAAGRPGERGTGGTDLVPFLKGVRNTTAATVLKI